MIEGLSCKGECKCVTWGATDHTWKHTFTVSQSPSVCTASLHLLPHLAHSGRVCRALCRSWAGCVGVSSLFCNVSYFPPKNSFHTAALMGLFISLSWSLEFDGLSKILLWKKEVFSTCHFECEEFFKLTNFWVPVCCSLVCSKPNFNSPATLLICNNVKIWQIQNLV